jgi:hypothetical protein
MFAFPHRPYAMTYRLSALFTFRALDAESGEAWVWAQIWVLASVSELPLA